VTNTGDASVIDLYLNGENDEQLYHTDQLKMDDSFELDVQHVVTAEDVQAGTVSIPLTITGENMDDESHVLEAAAYAEPADSTAEPTETPDDEQPTETPAEDQPAETAEPSASAEPAETPAATAQPQQQLPVTNAAPTAEPAATAVSVQTAAAQTPKTGVTGVTRWVILLGVCAGCLYLLNKKKH
jgi:FtsZ-interacting cell division protein ZipA